MRRCMLTSSKWKHRTKGRCPSNMEIQKISVEKLKRIQELADALMDLIGKKNSLSTKNYSISDVPFTTEIHGTANIQKG